MKTRTKTIACSARWQCDVRSRPNGLSIVVPLAVCYSSCWAFRYSFTQPTEELLWSEQHTVARQYSAQLCSYSVPIDCYERPSPPKNTFGKKRRGTQFPEERTSSMPLTAKTKIQLSTPRARNDRTILPQSKNYNLIQIFLLLSLILSPPPPFFFDFFPFSFVSVHRHCQHWLCT